MPLRCLFGGDLGTTLCGWGHLKGLLGIGREFMRLSHSSTAVPRCWKLVMGVGLINYLSGKSYLNALFLSCNRPCLSCSHAGGASFSNTRLSTDPIPTCTQALMKTDAGKQGRAPKGGTSKKIKIRCRSFEVKEGFIEARMLPMHTRLYACQCLSKPPEISSAAHSVK